MFHPLPLLSYVLTITNSSIPVHNEHNRPLLLFFADCGSDRRDESWEREQQGKMERTRAKKKERKKQREIRELIDATAGVIVFDNASAARTVRKGKPRLGTGKY